jgi:hypothetical protein
LFTHVCLGLPRHLFPSGFPTNIPYAFVFYQFWEEYKLWCSSLCSSLQPPVTSSLFGPNIFLNTLFSSTLSLRTSLNVKINFYTHTEPQTKL